LNKSALKWKRWAKDADQKIVDFENRVSEWEHRRDEASGWLDNYSDELTDLKSRRDEAAKEALGDIEKAVQDI
jgi:predicted  nucleic acid-binding Zn-ribbon protein